VADGDGHGRGHGHVAPDDLAAVRAELWQAENVELTTVGIDIGSSTSHLMFARVHLQRRAQALSSRFVVVDREVLRRSPVLLTPYLADNTIDAGVLDAFVARCYRDAGLTRAAVDSGAVVLTGEALKRRNARAIADLFAAESGKFVCASAGHHLEAAMAAHGSGAVAGTRGDPAVRLHVDIGGGTSKLAVLAGGEVLGTAAVAVGGRLVALDGRRVVRVEGPALQIARARGIPLSLGEALSDADEARLVEAFVQVLVGCMDHGAGGGIPPGFPADLLLADDRAPGARPVDVSFSGGVAEYLRAPDTPDFGDLARPLALGLSRALTDGRIGLRLRDTAQQIRATVIGASQFSVQVSGNTSGLAGGPVMPIRNLPVLHPHLDLSGPVSADETAAAVAAVARRLGATGADEPVAVAFRWRGDPDYARLRALAEGVVTGLAVHLDRGHPLVVLLDRDLAQSLGDVLTRELGVRGPVVCLDGLSLQEFDYVDIGEVIVPAGVVPLVIKSLLFAGPGPAAAEPGSGLLAAGASRG
jgi:ethanolamine utilization protein EutA